MEKGVILYNVNKLIAGKEGIKKRIKRGLEHFKL